MQNRNVAGYDVGQASNAERDRELGAKLAERIDHLFRTHLNQKGREYSYRQVAAAVSSGDHSRRGEQISATYVWGLRTGGKDNPTMRHLQGLARFFNVSPAYFFDEELTGLPEEARLLAATSRGSVRQLAVAALDLSDESLAVLLQLISRLRSLEGWRPDVSRRLAGIEHSIVYQNQDASH
jgi:transcriptional regulator with XRE-family HTH domain